VGPGEFPKQTIDLLQTFAAQSVLAIQNARLFHEIEDKSRQLGVASQHKSQFVANMSHELRTPLNAILGYTELILDDIYGEAPPKMRGVLDRVQRNGKHLLGLINDVLDLSKIEAGQLTLSLAEYSIKDVVHNVFSAVESLTNEKKLALRVEMPKDLPVGRGDERRLTQVLLNLVGNAINKGRSPSRLRQKMVPIRLRCVILAPGFPQPTRPSCSRSSNRPIIRPLKRRAVPGSA
jgi:signal transduction histidine kinase